MKNFNMQDMFAGIISGLVILGFFMILAVSYWRVAPDNPMTQQLVGALTIAFGGVVQYWVGSSRSSQVKDATLSEMAKLQPALLATPGAPHSGEAKS